MIHSGYNVYLSVQVAQCMFRLGEVGKARRILKEVLRRRSELWTYPEALHPRSGGGVMGDGYHGWAFAEILLLLREFVLHRRGHDVHIFRGRRARELMDADLEFGPFPMDGANASIRGRLGRSSGELTVDLPGWANTGAVFLELHLPPRLRLDEKARLKIDGGRLLHVAGDAGDDREATLRVEVAAGSESVRLQYS